MRSRTFREGSVGLLLLLGVGVFGLIIIWLNRVNAGRNSYKAIVEFANAGGMQKGAVVRYRGVKIGRISDIRPGPNNVEVEIEIGDSNLIIPSDVKVEANQSGLISESVVDITPKMQLLPSGDFAKPLDKNCNPQVIVCNGSRLKGQIGISLDELIRTTTDLATLYTNPQFYKNVNKAVENTAVAAESVAQLSRNLNVVSKSLQQQINGISETNSTIQQATTQLTSSTTKTLDQLSTSTTQTLNQISKTAGQFSGTAGQFGETAREIRLTANQANKLINNLDTVLVDNRSSLVAALNNITETSKALRQTVSSLSPTVNRVTQGQLLQNLETLSANAAQASANLRDVTNTLNNSNNLLVLQQTLDSARVTFENTQKITSDLDELTGDPAFRQNLRQLVNGLSSLVSSTQEIQQDIRVATTLDSIKAVVHNSKTATPPTTTKLPRMTFNIPLDSDRSPVKTALPTSITFSTDTPSTTQQQIVIDDVVPTVIKSFDKQPPQPPQQPKSVTNSINSPSSQENLLKQLRQHREARGE
ncbi:MCE family protein [Scytonema sp. UIC 10036]|uniref:MlaD family protein n=1 Tax=Scytonema sp. UIC 10036 TaxID=2304196 RepID=UPI0012DA1376|nr:MlaD family protein [Scytonema sp. UIC 10036]MUG93994.1 MCE family protein [Scytonema sp. UIC 10036]